MYLIQVLKNNRRIGELRMGRPQGYGTRYKRLETAKRVSENFVRRFSHYDCFVCVIRDMKTRCVAAQIGPASDLKAQR